MLGLRALAFAALLSTTMAYEVANLDFEQALLQPAFPAEDDLPRFTSISYPTAVSDVSNSIITAAPELDRRQAGETLCNSGLCGATQYCTAFQTAGPAIGICCGIGLTCTPQLDCVPHNPISDPGSRTAPVIFNDIVTCDRSRPYCIQINVVYGFGRNNLMVTNCFSENIGTTTTTNQWYYSNVILGLSSSTSSFTTTSESTSSSTSTTSTTSTSSTSTTTTGTSTFPPEPIENDNSLSTGAIAGIVVGSVAIVCIAACVLAFMFFRRRKRLSQTEAPPTYYPPQQAGYYAPPKVEQQSYAPPVVPQSPSTTAYNPYETQQSPTMVAVGGTGQTSPDNRASHMSELPGSNGPYATYRPQ